VKNVRLSGQKRDSIAKFLLAKDIKELERIYGVKGYRLWTLQDHVQPAFDVFSQKILEELYTPTDAVKKLLADVKIREYLRFSNHRSISIYKEDKEGALKLALRIGITLTESAASKEEDCHLVVGKDDLGTEIYEYRNTCREKLHELRRKKSEIVQAMVPYTTAKSLLEAWPEIKDAVDYVCYRPQDTSILPAPLFTELNKKLGLGV